MCQIFAGTSRQIRGVLLDTKYLLADLYDNNSDGLGAMYPTTKHGLRIRKDVPHTLAQAERFIRELPDDDRNLVLHFRMKTSGNIDRDNAHPFVVLPRSLAMTHNGVLSISTKSDESKCDTRHYIERILLPQLGRHPDLVDIPEWLDLVGDDIGTSNRFVFMDAEGEMYFVNRHTGVEHDGMWVANTYSFDASLLIPGYKSKTTWYGRATSGRGSVYGYDDEYDGYWLGDSHKGNVLVPADGAGIDIVDDADYALANYDVSALAEIIEQFPLATFQYLFREWRFDPAVDIEAGLAAHDRHLAKLLLDEDVTELAALVRFNPNKATHLAEVCCWYGDWVSRYDESGDWVGRTEADVPGFNEQYAA